MQNISLISSAYFIYNTYILKNNAYTGSVKSSGIEEIVKDESRMLSIVRTSPSTTRNTYSFFHIEATA